MNTQELTDQNKIWKCAVVAIIKSYKRNTKFTCDKVRMDVILRGLAPPATPNQWGAAISAAAKQQLITRTGRVLPSNIKTSHASIVLEWVRL